MLAMTHQGNLPLNFPIYFCQPGWNRKFLLHYVFSVHRQVHSSSVIWKKVSTAKSLQSCLTLCDPIDGSPPGSPVPGILQARTLEWVVISFSNAGKWKVKVKTLSCVWPSATPWTTAYQAPPSMGFSRQECWSGVPLLSPPKSIYFAYFEWAQCQIAHDPILLLLAFLPCSFHQNVSWSCHLDTDLGW